MKFSLNDKGPKSVSKYRIINALFIKALEENTSFITCAAGLRRYQLEHKYDPAYVINTAYLWACDEIDREETIENFPSWINLTCTIIIRQLSKEEKEKENRQQQLYPEMLPVPQETNWLDEQEATFEQLQMRAEFAHLS